MKRIAMIITMVVMVAIVGGFSVNAEQNRDVTYPVLNTQILNTQNEEENIGLYKIEIEELVEELAIPKDKIKEASSVVSGGASWIYAKTQEGSTGSKTTSYERMFNKDGDLLSRIEIPGAEKVEKAKPAVYEGGQKAQADAFFDTSSLTRYGAQGTSDSSAGIGLGQKSVRQQDGSWKKGITYEGYYLVASSSVIPLFSILEVSDHTMSGMGIESGIPFKAIVVDRKSSISGSQVELYSGSNDNKSVSQGKSTEAKVKIKSVSNTNLRPKVIVEEPVVSKVSAAPKNNAVQSAASTGGASNEISHLTRYGVNCYGCNLSAEGRGATASGLGVGLDSVRQKNGTWQQGITYEGYYIIAAPSNYPINTIVEISNHTLSGSGITPGVPFKAIVADRGGGITGSRIDIFVGSENNMLLSQGSQYNAQIRVID